MSRVRVELGGIQGRGRSSNHSGDDGGTPTGIRSEVQWMLGWQPRVGSKTRNANMIQKAEGPRQNCHGSSYNYGRQTIKACERSEQRNNLEGRSDSGNNTSKRSKVTQPKTDAPQKMRSSEDTRMDQPITSSSKRGAAWALQLKMQMYYPLRWLHRSGVVRQVTGERVEYLLEMQRQNRTSTKEDCLP